MPLYLTPARYQSMGQGVDLTDIEDQDLASHIQIASGLVNTWCNAHTSHDFRGGSVTDEEHEWKINNYMWPASGMIYPKHKPLIELTSMKLYVTNTQFLDIDPSRTHYHETENMIETLFSESSIGIWAATNVPIAGFKQPSAHLTYTYGYSFPVTDEQMFPDGGITWRAQNQWWDSTIVPVIKVNGTAVDAGDLTIDYDEGTVDIDDDVLTALDISAEEVDNVSASYTHKLPANVMNATAIVTTSLLGARAIVAKGMQGLSGIKVEEVEIRQSRDAQIAKDEIPGNAQMLLTPYRYLHWGA